MLLGAIQTIVRANVNDAAADVDQSIVDAVNFLSNFFHVRKIDTSETTVLDATVIDYANDFLRVRKLVINGDFIKELGSDEDLESIDDEDTQRWFIADGQIQLTRGMSSTGDPIIIHYDAEFIQPEAAVSTDVPCKLLELIFVGATYRYFGILAAKVMTEREGLPDVSPKEILAARDDWKKMFDDLLKKLT